MRREPRSPDCYQGEIITRALVLAVALLTTALGIAATPAAGADAKRAIFGRLADGSLPFGKRHNVGMLNWGFVDEKTQTRQPWTGCNPTMSTPHRLGHHRPPFSS